MKYFKKSAAKVLVKMRQESTNDDVFILKVLCQLPKDWSDAQRDEALKEACDIVGI